MSSPEVTRMRSRCRILGLEITPFALDELVDLLKVAIAHSEPRIFFSHNLHSAYLFNKRGDVRGLYARADFIRTDGAPVLWDYRLSGGRARNERIGSTDWIPRLPEVTGLARIAAVGTTPEANAAFVAWLQQRLPDAEIVGIPGSGWGDEKADQAIELLRDFTPQLVLVGLGMPLQERFAVRAQDEGIGAVIATVGGAFDQLAGIQRNAPRWIGKLGIEWIWRLVTQPRRLWRRYLVEPWKLWWLRARWGFRMPR